jgi:hypothetical protein
MHRDTWMIFIQVESNVEGENIETGELANIEKWK